MPRLLHTLLQLLTPAAMYRHLECIEPAHQSCVCVAPCLCAGLDMPAPAPRCCRRPRRCHCRLQQQHQLPAQPQRSVHDRCAVAAAPCWPVHWQCSECSLQLAALLTLCNMKLVQIGSCSPNFITLPPPFGCATQQAACLGATESSPATVCELCRCPVLTGPSDSGRMQFTTIVLLRCERAVAMDSRAPLSAKSARRSALELHTVRPRIRPPPYGCPDLPSSNTCITMTDLT